MGKMYFFQWGFTESKTDYSYVIMVEAVKSKKIHLYSGPHFLHSEMWNRIHAEVCRRYPGLAKVFYPFYLPRGMDRNKENIFLFNEWHPCLMNLGFVDWIKGKYGGKTVLILRNMIVNKKCPAINGVDLNVLKKIFDLVVTNEANDAERYDLFFLPNPFSPLYRKRAKIKYDICFIGKNKGREGILKRIAEEADKNNIIWDFKIAGERKRKSVFEYVDYQPYTEIIKQDMRSNCILEIVQPGQTSCTLRFQEAVCLGKKLLTNNEWVKNEKYYNPEYIQIFKRPEDIDWNFVKEKKNVDYQYYGDYSPIFYLDRIKEELEKRK